MRNQNQRERGKYYKDPGENAFLSGTRSRASKCRQLSLSVQSGWWGPVGEEERAKGTLEEPGSSRANSDVREAPGQSCKKISIHPLLEPSRANSTKHMKLYTVVLHDLTKIFYGKRLWKIPRDQECNRTVSGSTIGLTCPELFCLIHSLSKVVLLVWCPHKIDGLWEKNNTWRLFPSPKTRF